MLSSNAFGITQWVLSKEQMNQTTQVPRGCLYAGTGVTILSDPQSVGI